MFSPNDSICLIARHLQAARDQEPACAYPIAEHIFHLAVSMHVPMDVVTTWLYSSQEWTTGHEFSHWARMSGEVTTLEA